MHTGPQFTTTQQTSPPGGGRGSVLLIGGIAFALVFLLIVGATVGYLVLRGGDPTGGGPTDPSSVSQTVTDPESPSGSETPSESPTPTEVTEERCWTPDSNERVSTNPSGKLRGGGLQFIPPVSFDSRAEPSYLIAYMTDVYAAMALVEGSWYSQIIVGAVQWQPGIEYPGAEVASQKITDCLFYAPIWGDTKGRSLDDKVTAPVTVAGMPGYQTTATVNWQSSKLEKTTATALQVVVLDTPEGPSAFIAETAIGTPEHQEAASEAYSSLTGIS